MSEAVCLPPARIAARGPTETPPPCRPAAPDFAVTAIADNLKVDQSEFKQMHRIGIARFSHKNLEKMTAVGPGKYDPLKGFAFISPRPAAPSVDSHSPRLCFAQKTPEEQEHDNRMSLRRNLLGLRDLFLKPMVSEHGEVDASPRWLRPTKAAAMRRKETLEIKASVVPQPPALPMTFSLSDGQTTAAQTAPISSSPRPSSSTVRKKESTAGESSLEAREASLRKTLARPSSATTKYSRGNHWVHGTVQHCAIAGVSVVNPKEGKTDAMYDLDRCTGVVQPAPPRVSMGTSPRFPGDLPLRRPATATVRVVEKHQ